MSLETGGNIEEILFFYPEQAAGLLLSGYELKGLTPDILFWSSPDPMSTTRPEPICSATRQDVFLSLIKCGVNPLSGFNGQPEKAKPEVLQSTREPRSKLVARRKELLFVEADRETIDRWEAKSRACWRRILTGEKNTDFGDGIILTGSGTAANKISMLTARDLVGQGAVF